MTVLAEISDKMPSTAGIIVIAVTAGTACAGIALTNRIVAWSMLGITLLVGCPLAYVAFDDAFVSGPLRDAVWSELGWPWVLANIIGPLLPSVCVAGVLFLRRWPMGARGFPIDGQGASRMRARDLTTRSTRRSFASDSLARLAAPPWRE